MAKSWAWRRKRRGVVVVVKSGLRCAGSSWCGQMDGARCGGQVSLAGEVPEHSTLLSAPATTVPKKKAQGRACSRYILWAFAVV